MSMLIKGMEMPDDCKTCDLCHCCDGFMRFCFVNDVKIADEGRREDCPLIEVPTPHGRLIDVDELENDADWSVYYDDYMACSEYQICHALTVIEAEE